MSILTVTSTNPDFSFVISKNPTTIRESGKPFQRSLRRGQLYGWFSSALNDRFRLWFKDHPTESSFADGVRGDFEYLDKTRYSSPLLPIMMVQTALASCSKSRQEKDVDGYECSATATVRISSVRLLEQLASHYGAEASIDWIMLAEGYGNLMVTAPTVFQTLNILQTVCVLLCMRDPDTYVVLDKAGVDKYLRVLNNSNAPYYVRYLFGSRAVTNRAMFESILPQLQGEGMTMAYGDTRQQRYDAVQRELKGGTRLIDIGCGEMFYALRLCKRYEDLYAIDADEELTAINDRKLKARGVENVTAWPAKVDADWVNDNVGLISGSDVLATEVLEHMPRAEADALLEALLKTEARSVIVTVPNANFNQNYGLGDEFRHSDHHYEPTFEEWCDHTVTLAAENGWAVNNVPVGDVVNDQSVTTMSVFTRLE